MINTKMTKRIKICSKIFLIHFVIVKINQCCGMINQFERNLVAQNAEHFHIQSILTP